MTSRRRQALALLLLVLLLPGLFVVGVWLGGHPENLPGFIDNALVGNRETRVVGEAIDRVTRDYYRPVSRSALASASISGMLSSLHDPYSEYLSPKELSQFNQPASFAGIGVVVQPTREGLEVVRVFDGSPAQHAGLRTGETILAVNGRLLRGLSSSTATGLVKGPPGTDVHLRLRAPGVTGVPRASSATAGPAKTTGQARAGRATVRTVTVTRATISQPVVASGLRHWRGLKLGWAYLATFSEGSHLQLRKAVDELLHEGARGIVLDLRANGGGLVSEAQAVASMFIPGGQVVVTMRGRSQPTQVLRATGNPIPSSVPVVVLVDRGTASASEIVTAALQDHHRATVVGTHTYGKGVFQELEPLSSGGAIKITVGEYYTPNGRNLGGRGVSEGAGIAPEVRVAHGVDGEHGLQVALGTLAAKVG